MPVAGAAEAETLLIRQTLGAATFSHRKVNVCVFLPFVMTDDRRRLLVQWYSVLCTRARAFFFSALSIRVIFWFCYNFREKGCVPVLYYFVVQNIHGKEREDD